MLLLCFILSLFQVGMSYCSAIHKYVPYLQVLADGSTGVVIKSGKTCTWPDEGRPQRTVTLPYSVRVASGLWARISVWDKDIDGSRSDVLIGMLSDMIVIVCLIGRA